MNNSPKPSKPHLDTETERFFSLHWGPPLPSPRWDYSWTFSGPVPNYLLGGLYALFAGEPLAHIGLGASRGGGIYRNRGISRRLMAHVLKPPLTNEGRRYRLADRWANTDIDLVATLGLSTDFNYLAPALEDYLIGKISPKENRLKIAQ